MTRFTRSSIKTLVALVIALLSYSAVSKADENLTLAPPPEQQEQAKEMLSEVITPELVNAVIESCSEELARPKPESSSDSHSLVKPRSYSNIIFGDHFLWETVGLVAKRYATAPFLSFGQIGLNNRISVGYEAFHFARNVVYGEFTSPVTACLNIVLSYWAVKLVEFSFIDPDRSLLKANGYPVVGDFAVLTTAEKNYFEFYSWVTFIKAFLNTLLIWMGQPALTALF